MKMLKNRHYLNNYPGSYYLALIIIYLLTLSGSGSIEVQDKWKTDLFSYINEKLAKPDGGYGWEDQYDSHLTPTYAVVGILSNLGQLPENKKELIEFIRTHHPQRGPNKEAGPSGTEIRSLVYQQIQSIIWLGGDVADFEEEVSGWKSQAGKLANYEKQGYPVLYQEVMTPVCRKLLRLPLDEVKPEFESYLEVRQRKNGSYNNAPFKDGGDGNILNTYWSIYTLNSFGLDIELKSEVINWIKNCQLENGGFTHQPDAEIGNVDDVAYTWAAVKTLQLLSSKPGNAESCIKYLISLRNSDGGFGKRPGMHSTPMSTFYAVDALKALDAFPSMKKTARVRISKKEPVDFSEYKVFTAQFEASGSGSPLEAVMLADSLGINLWGSKNAGAGWVEFAQNIADEKKVPLTFFQSDEPYGKNVHVPGMGTFGHILDYIAPAGNEYVPFKISTSGQDFRKSAIQLEDSLSWQEFMKEAIRPLLDNNGGLILQVANNEFLARILLDESIENGGYIGISTIHFGQNFLFWLPYLNQYRYQLPFVALQDAHGTESWWWSNELVSYRNLFIAKEPTYNEMIKAMRNNWMVAVRHDSISDYKTRILGGTDEARQFIVSKQNSWKWWDEKTNKTNHPWAAVTVITPGDTFEVARPDAGVNIRIRCWWDGVRNSIRKPLVQMEQLKIDNNIIQSDKISKVDRRNTDSYYLYHFAEPSEGKHIVEVRLRHIRSGTERTITHTFTYKGR